MREAIRVVCPSKMVFNVNPDTLEPLAVSTYDAWAFSDLVPGSISEAEYYRRLALLRAKEERE